MNKILAISAVLLLVIASILLFATLRNFSDESPAEQDISTAPVTTAATQPETYTESAQPTTDEIPTVEEPTEPADEPFEIYTVNGLTYIDGILIANKTYSLPSDYNPGGLLPETNDAFEQLVQGAAYDGINIYLSSGFRSYDYQDQIYNNYCDIYGQATADTFSARPGHSEHQTGMAIDVNIIDDTFIGTPEAIWIEAHCEEYGFILRYPPGKQDITGYKYEPWHIRYVGVDTAQKLRAKAEELGDPYLTLEEYFGIDSVYSE